MKIWDSVYICQKTTQNLWSGRDWHMWQVQYKHRRLQTSPMRLQILCQHLEGSRKTNQNKIWSECDNDISQCNGIRWPLFSYLHQQFAVLIKYFSHFWFTMASWNLQFYSRPLCNILLGSCYSTKFRVENYIM